MASPLQAVAGLGDPPQQRESGQRGEYVSDVKHSVPPLSWCSSSERSPRAHLAARSRALLADSRRCPRARRLRPLRRPQLDKWATSLAQAHVAGTRSGRDASWRDGFDARYHRGRTEWPPALRNRRPWVAAPGTHDPRSQCQQGRRHAERDQHSDPIWQRSGSVRHGRLLSSPTSSCSISPLLRKG